MRRPKLDEIQAARVENQLQLRLVDLTTDRYLLSTFSGKELNHLIDDIIIWPMIAICSIKVGNHKNHFKPEYIIPQMILQWVRYNSAIVQGIKFSSTHIDLNIGANQGEFYNIVIPVYDNKPTGYCSTLSKMFKMTDVLSWQLYQFSSGGPGVAIKYDNPFGPNHDITKLELVQNREHWYEFSPFATLELALQTMKLQEVNFD